jgi:quinoprotein glucose dehydrogenase
MKKIVAALLTGACFVAAPAVGQSVPGSANEWPTYGHDAGGMRYSPLTQITPANVGKLQVAWVYHMRPANYVQPANGRRGGGGAGAAAGAGAPPAAAGGRGGIVGGGGGVGGLFDDPNIPNRIGPGTPGLVQSESTPLVINGVMYATTPYSRIVALNPVTGKEIWVYQIPNNGQASTRGLEYWPGDAKSGPELIVHASYGGILALSAKTGQPVQSFGVGGMLVAGPSSSSSSPPLVVGNVIVSQSANPNNDGRNGDVRGFDIHTGKQLWRFNSIPQPGDKLYGTWAGGSADGRSGVHMWGLLTADTKRGIVYMTFNAPNNNRYGGDRPGNNLFSTSVVAADAATGKYLWHFQLVHHDIWDADMQSPPMLFDVVRNGKTIPAVAAVNKMALLFILNRVTGEPIYKIEEKPVPQSVNPDERTAPTQPIPVEIPPLARQNMTEADIANITPEHNAFCKKFIADNKIKLEGGPYLPAGYKYPIVQFPGTIGGPNWGGMSFNPKLGYLFVNTMDLGQVEGLDLAPARAAPRGQQPVGAPPAGGGRSATPSQGPQIAEGGDNDYPGAGNSYSFMQPFGRFKEANSDMMCNAPPWGRLTAVNVNTGKFAWQVPLGVTDGLPAGQEKTGRPNLGGSIATASGLIFIGATDDKRFRAFDARTGKELWTVKMPAVAQSVPITYRAKDGRQYVVVTATGGGFMQMPLESDTITAFALPKK